MTSSPTATVTAPSPAGRPALAIAVVATLLVVAAAAPAALARSPYAQGDEVVFTGVVTDADGLPVPDLQIAVEASRATFSVARLGKVRQHATRLATVTDKRGEFSLPWRWDDYYNRFDLVVSVPVRTSEGEKLVELQRVDVSRRTRQGSPVVSAIQVDDTGLVDRRREFLAALDSADERRVYEQAGQPDRMDRVSFPTYEEVTWWYFRHGRAYRFHDGTLRQVIPFDPVEPFAP